jgi:hypothetical protein
MVSKKKEAEKRRRKEEKNKKVTGGEIGQPFRVFRVFRGLTQKVLISISISDKMKTP